jgi:hypothetical protein
MNLFTFDESDKPENIFKTKNAQINKPILIKDPRHVSNKSKALKKSKSSIQFAIDNASSNLKKDSIFDDYLRQSRNQSIFKDNESSDGGSQAKRKSDINLFLGKTSFCNKKSEKLSKNLIK